MAKTKKSKKKPARKTASKKTAAKKRSKTFATEGPLPPKQREKALRKLGQLFVRPSHPSEITGPAMTLGYEAPLPKKSTATKRASKRGKKKR